MIANAKRTNAPDKYAAVTRIPIADQIARDLLPATGGRQLIGDPLRRWVSGDPEPQDLSPAMADHQQSIEKSEGDGRNDKQVHRRNAIRMVAQERLPAQGRWSSPARHILGDASLPNVDAELEQLAVDAWRTPQRIGDTHLPD